MEPSTANGDAPLTPKPTQDSNDGRDRLLRVVEAEAVKAGSDISGRESRPARGGRLYVVPTPPRDRDQPLPTPTLGFGSRRPVESQREELP